MHNMNKQDLLGTAPFCVTTIAGDEATISAPTILRSAAGWYIGRTINTASAGTEPFDRISAGFYPSRKAAEQALATASFTDRRACAIEYQDSDSQ